MRIYTELKHRDHFFAACDLKQNFPEIKKLDTEEIEHRLRNMKVRFFSLHDKPVGIWIRLTMPFAMALWIILFVLVPINFLVTGRWGYSWLWLINWFKALGI